MDERTSRQDVRTPTLIATIACGTFVIPKMKISVVIPVLNERACLPATVESIRAAIEEKEREIIVVDGGSTDGTGEWLRGQLDVKIMTAQTGKGRQQNAGGFAAQGDVLLFLHADCRVPPDAEKQLAHAMDDSRVSGGCFYVRWTEPKLALRIVAFAMNLRTRLFHTCYGDQALFVRRTVFHAIGGFPDWPLFEDLELLKRFKRVGRFAIINSPVTVSARRLLAWGVWRTVGFVYVLQLAYWVGIHPTRLKQWFGDIRPHLKQTIAEGVNPNHNRCDRA